MDERKQNKPDIPTEDPNRIYQPDEDGEVPDLPDSEVVYPVPNIDGLPDGTVVEAQLSEPDAGPTPLAQAIRDQEYFDDWVLADEGSRTEYDDEFDNA